MAKDRGAWGDPHGKVPKIVTREEHVMRNATVSRDEEKEVQAEAPKLKYVSSPVYEREPFDPEFHRQEARGTDDVQGGE